MFDEDFRYKRFGHIDQGTFSDHIVKEAVKLTKTYEVLPPRWSWKSAEHFVDTYGPGFRWAKTANFHLLMLNGFHIMRLWTNVGGVCRVDVCDTLASRLKDVEPIPEGNRRKCKPFEKRITITHISQLVFLFKQFKFMYGLDSEWVSF